MTTWECWIDIETTGLDPATDRILEVGAVMVSPDGAEHELQLVVGYPQEWWPELGEWVRDQHATSGLLMECAESILTESLADVVLLEWVNQLAGEDRVVLGGSGLLFDIGFLKVHGFSIVDRAEYWVLDSGVARRLFRGAGIGWDAGTSAGETKTHRALEDARAHLDEWRRAKTFVAGAA